MAVFNESIYTNKTLITDLFTVSNQFSGNVLGLGIWFLITFGGILITSQFQMKETLIAASFISLISSFFLLYIGWISPFLFFLSFVFFLVSLVMSWWDKLSTGA